MNQEGDHVNILFICHRFPFPPNHGRKIRPFQMIKHLGRKHRVSVASLVQTIEEEREAEGLAPFCDRYEAARVSDLARVTRMIARLPTLTPSSMGNFYSPTLARWIKSVLSDRQFDLILVHSSSVAQYVEDVRGIHKLLDFADMDSQKWLEYANYKAFPSSIGYWLEGVKMMRAEKRLARKFDVCTVVTPAERETLDGYNVDAATDWFPNGVDTEYFSPVPDSYDPDTICFIGRMDYYPNEECMTSFCDRILPKVRARRRDVKLLIVGADPSPAVRRLGHLPGVTVTGSVADVRPYLQRSGLMVAPLHIARGTQNKILEAMAAGIPVVTSKVAARGVDAIPGEHFCVAESADEWTDAVLRILGDKTERNRLAQSARTRVLSHHSWGRSMQRLDEIIERCLRLPLAR